MSSRASDTYDTSATFETPRARTRGAPTIRYESYDYSFFYYYYLKGVVGVVGIGSPAPALCPGSDTLSRRVAGRVSPGGLCVGTALQALSGPSPPPEGLGAAFPRLEVFARISAASTATDGLIVLRSSCEK